MKFQRMDVQAVNGRRVWVVDQLAALIRNGAIPKSDDWVQSVLDWFVVHGIFIVKKKSSKSSIKAVCVMLLCLGPSFLSFVNRRTRSRDRHFPTSCVRLVESDYLAV